MFDAIFLKRSQEGSRVRNAFEGRLLPDQLTAQAMRQQDRTHLCGNIAMLSYMPVGLRGDNRKHLKGGIACVLVDVLDGHAAMIMTRGFWYELSVQQCFWGCHSYSKTLSMADLPISVAVLSETSIHVAFERFRVL